MVTEGCAANRERACRDAARLERAHPLRAALEKARNNGAGPSLHRGFDGRRGRINHGRGAQLSLCRSLVATASSLALCSLLTATLLALPAGAQAEESCPNAISRGGLSASLPDCRAYELVTPLDKGVASDMFGASGQELGPPNPSNEYVSAGERGASSEDGNSFLMESAADFGEPFAASGEAAYVFTRGADGWTTTSLASPSLGAQHLIAREFSTDLSAVSFQDYSPGREGEPSETDRIADLVGPPGGPYTTIAQGFENSPLEVDPVGASSDLSHIVGETRDYNLAPADANQEQGSALYEFTGGQVHLINVNSKGALLSTCGAVLGASGGFDAELISTHNAVSNTGKKIFFTAPDPNYDTNGPACPDNGPEHAGGDRTPSVPPELYMRLDGTRTIEISVPAKGVYEVGGQQMAVFVGASEDGSRVFFLTRGELTKDDKGLHSIELYEYNTKKATLTRISHGESGDAEGNVSSVPVVSADGSTVYFIAAGQLTNGAPEGGGLYRYDTETETTTFVTGGVEMPPDYIRATYWEAFMNLYNSPGQDQQADYYATANGNFLVFPSTQNITAYNSQGYQELYLYNATEGSITCVSCNPNGFAPTASAAFTRQHDYIHASGLAPRPVSEDGSYVFFDTSNALVPNASRGVIHVYEWHNGAISLIGSPSDPSDSFFMEASADGSNVFFGTHAQLVPQDTEVGGNLYDARIDGGFEQPSSTKCSGTGCQGPPSAPPVFATPPSVTFNGVGNFEPTTTTTSTKQPLETKTKPKSCKRGFVKKHGRCVRRKAKRSAKGRK